MILLVPIVVVGVARLAGRLPLSPRYAARDAARHRTRTVPAVAAVAATVAGVVALGIAVTSDEAENRGTYRPRCRTGWDRSRPTSDEDPVDWTPLRRAAERELPDATLTEVRGVLENAASDGTSFYLNIGTADSDRLLESYGGSWGASTLVGTESADLPIELSAERPGRPPSGCSVRAGSWPSPTAASPATRSR